MVADCSMELARVRMEEVVADQGAATGQNERERQKILLMHILLLLSLALSFINGGFVAKILKGVGEGLTI